MTEMSSARGFVGPSFLLGAPAAAAPERPVPPPPLRRAQRLCYEAIGRALKEGNVFAAVTGPAGSGKSTVLDAVLADHGDRSLRCIRIQNPGDVSRSLASQIVSVAELEADKPDNQDRHIVLVVDDAHGASRELLSCLSTLAAMREPGRRVPQVLLAGLPDLWVRLAAAEYEPLRRRLAVRTELVGAEQDTDPWEAVDQDVQATMAAAQYNSVPAPMHGFADAGADAYAGADPDMNHYSAGPQRGTSAMDDADVAPPNLFALFPDAPPVAARPAPSRRFRRAVLILLPFGCLAAAAIVFSALDDWPYLFKTEAAPQTATVPATVPATSIAAAPMPAAPPAVAPVAPVVVAPVSSPAPAPRPSAVAGPAASPAPEPAVAPERAEPATAAVTPAPAATPVPAPAPPVAAARPAALSPAVLATLLKRGDEQAALGDVSSARLLFERAAESGDAGAALRLARSYDPALLPASDATTLGDRQVAFQWYGRAAALGSKDAATRLQEWTR